MNPNDVAPPSIPLPESNFKSRDKDESKKFSFWISQFFILLATVLGVYLASSQGFKQALAYGNIQGDRANYYLRKSLQGEIADNLELVREYMKRLKGGSLADRKAPFRLDTFVWENMKYSSATLETPPELLRESRVFYRGIADLQEKIANNTYSADKGIEKLQELVKHMEVDVFPKFADDTAALQKSLQERGVRVQ